jgi:predicted ArsR family transcriptional regulator
MEDKVLSRARRIGDPRMAACFSNPLRRQLVMLLAREERSLTELADATGHALKTLHYHVTVLHRLGLLVIAHERQRAGRSVKIYRAIAPAFYVPESVTPSGSIAALALEMRQSLDRRRGQSQDGTIYCLSESGAPLMRAVKNRAAPDGLAAEYWKVLRLTRIQAIRLEKDVAACLKKYSNGNGNGAAKDTYLVHFAFAPRQSAPARVRVND